MKKIISLLVFTVILFTNAFAQQNVINEKHQRVLTHVTENVYDVVFKDPAGDIVQKGQYLKIDNRFVPHGEWTLFAYQSDEIITRSKFDKGEQVWVKTNVNGQVIEADQKLLAIKQLESKISTLERKLAELEQ